MTRIIRHINVNFEEFSVGIEESSPGFIEIHGNSTEDRIDLININNKRR